MGRRNVDRTGYQIAPLSHGCGVKVTHIASGLEAVEQRSLSSDMNADLALDALAPKVAKWEKGEARHGH